jgi:deazaflavin-dependent oxidoreductase (nitroreductase family)
MNNSSKASVTTFVTNLYHENIKSLLDKLYALAPEYAWRLGLGPVLGRYIMLITQINHKTGNPCKTSMEFFEVNGIKYIANVFGIQSKWYRNILANPRVTIQTADGTEQMVAVPVTADDEFITIIEWLLHRNPKFANQYIGNLEPQTNRKGFLKYKEELTFLRFDPTSEPTPRGLDVDLAWIWPILLIWSIIIRPRRKN